MIDLLSKRQEHILQLLVQLYTDEGVPVGSKTLMNKGVKASSATIRNDLAKLEECGLIQKMHTSSGRVPSMEGYRFYVDNLLTTQQVDGQQIERVKKLLDRRYNGTKDLLRWSSTVLSDLTGYTAFTLAPVVDERHLTDVQFVPLNTHQFMAVLVIDQGFVESRMISIPRELTQDDIEKMIVVIQERLVGETLLTVYQKLRTEIPLVLQKYFSNSSHVLTVLEDVFHEAFEDPVYVSGGMNLIDNSAIADVSDFKSIYTLIHDTNQLTNLLFSAENKKVGIRIGEELNNELLQNMSLITASYDIFERGTGFIAVLGPANMSYSKLISLMSVVTNEISNHLEMYYRQLENGIY